MPTSEPKLSPGPAFSRLVEIMAQLRSPGGCPWDREQNFDTIKPYLLEETYEVMDAIDQRDWNGLAEELGDLLLQSVFFAQMASEEGRFDIADSLEAINSKLVRPSSARLRRWRCQNPPGEVLRKWDEIKKTEKPRSQGLLTGVPRTLSALVEAQQIASRAATAGFDWENIDQVFDKLKEEIAELNAAESHDQKEDELGDLLFVIVNLAAFPQGRSPSRRSAAPTRNSAAASLTSNKASPRKEKPGPQDATIAEMESLWQAAKKL